MSAYARGIFLFPGDIQLSYAAPGAVTPGAGFSCVQVGHIGLRLRSKCDRLNPARRAGPAPKGGTPMSALEVIALLTLVIAAVSLGYQIKK